MPSRSPCVNTFCHTTPVPYHEVARRGGVVIVRNPAGEPTFPQPITIVNVPPKLVGGQAGAVLVALDTGHPFRHRVVALRILRQFQATRRAAVHN